MKIIQSILWHSLFIITLFPGIFMLLLDRIAKLKKIKSIERYIISLVFVSMINLVVFSKSKELILVLLFSILLFVIEYLIIIKDEKKLKRKIKYYYYNMKEEYIIVVLYPFFEEIIYRQAIYHLSIKQGYNLWQYIVLSVFSFLFAHYYSQGFEAIKKLPFAIVQCIFYILYNNIYICILIHVVFNIQVYLYRISSYKNKNSYF